MHFPHSFILSFIHSFTHSFKDLPSRITAITSGFDPENQGSNPCWVTIHSSSDEDGT